MKKITVNQLGKLLPHYLTTGQDQDLVLEKELLLLLSQDPTVVSISTAAWIRAQKGQFGTDLAKLLDQLTPAYLPLFQNLPKGEQVLLLPFFDGREYNAKALRNEVGMVESTISPYLTRLCSKGFLLKISPGRYKINTHDPTFHQWGIKRLASGRRERERVISELDAEKYPWKQELINVLAM